MRNNIQPTPTLFCQSLNERPSKQQYIVLSVFESEPGKGFTPFQVQNILNARGHEYPITSVRRAITNLTDDGELVKHEDKKKKERYGAANCTWQYNNYKNRIDQY